MVAQILFEVFTFKFCIQVTHDVRSSTHRFRFYIKINGVENGKKMIFELTCWDPLLYISVLPNSVYMDQVNSLKKKNIEKEKSENTNLK